MRRAAGRGVADHAFREPALGGPPCAVRDLARASRVDLEVDFRRGIEELDLEAELDDDGRLRVEVCADDD